MHIPLLAELVDLREMGSQALLKQCTEGFPMKGGLAEPGVFPTANAEAPELSRLWKKRRTGRRPSKETP